MNPINEIVRFQDERNLSSTDPNWFLETTNIVEELLEARGHKHIDKDRLRHFIEDSMVPTFYVLEIINNEIEPDTETQVDAAADIIVFAIGWIMKLGYDPNCVLDEVAKEINSRKQDPEQKKEYPDGLPQGIKWMKDRNQNPATLYKANFSQCKRK